MTLTPILADPLIPANMRPDLEALLILQDRDQKIKALQAQLKNLPREKKTLEDKLASARGLVDQSKALVKANEVEKQKLELEAEGKRGAIGRFKTQQQQTRKNEEYQALSNEIKHFESEIHALEDRELDVMERAEELRRADLVAGKEFAKAEATIKEQISRLETGATASDERLRELQADHAKLAGTVPEDVVDLYRRLFTKKGDAAVVPLENEICGGCHMKVPTQTTADVRGEQKIAQCPQCGRILYRVL